MLRPEDLDRLRDVCEFATIDELVELRNSFTRHAENEQARAVQEVLDKKVKAESAGVRPPKPLPTPKPQPTAEELKTARKQAERDEERRIMRETQNGRYLPRPKDPDFGSQYASQRAYDLFEKSRPRVKRDPRSCTTCKPGERGPDCGGQCEVPGFFE
jgi:hypothetical protein